MENECEILTTSNENDLIDLTKKQEEISDEQAKFVELTQIVEQKGSKNLSSSKKIISPVSSEMDKKHLTDRNQSLSDRLFSQQTDVELQRHIRSNSELKQQHEVLLSTLLLEQQLHTTAANEHKRLVKEVTQLKLISSKNNCHFFSYKKHLLNIKCYLVHINIKLRDHHHRLLISI